VSSNYLKMVENHQFISESIMEGPVYQVPGSRALLAEGDAERKQQKAIEAAQKRQRAAAAQLRKREEKLAKAQKKAEEQLGSPSRWATLFER